MDEIQHEITDVVNTTTTGVPPDDAAVIVSSYLKFAVGTLVLFPILTFGNGLTLLAILLTPRLRSLQYLHVANLAAADLVVGLGALLDGVNAFPSFQCDFSASSPCSVLAFGAIFLGATESLLALLLLSVDRLIYIVYPFTYFQPTTARLSKLAVAVSWIASISVAATNDYFRQTTPGNCHTEGAGKSFYQSGLPGTFLVVAVVTSLCYAKIVWVSRQQRERVAQIPTASSANTVHPAKSISVFFIINTIFVLCWMPYILNTSMVECDRTSQLTKEMLFGFGDCSSVVNVVIYAWINKDLREAYKRLLCWKREALSPG